MRILTSFFLALLLTTGAATAANSTDDGVPGSSESARGLLNWGRVGPALFRFQTLQVSSGAARSTKTDANALSAQLAYERLLPRWKLLVGARASLLSIKDLGNGEGGSLFVGGVSVRRAVAQFASSTLLLASLELERDFVAGNAYQPAAIAGRYFLLSTMNLPVGLELSFPVWKIRGTVGAAYHPLLSSPEDFALSSYSRFSGFARLSYGVGKKDYLLLTARFSRLKANYASRVAQYQAEDGELKQNGAEFALTYTRRF